MHSDNSREGVLTSLSKTLNNDFLTPVLNKSFICFQQTFLRSHVLTTAILKPGSRTVVSCKFHGCNGGIAACVPLSASRLFPTGDLGCRPHLTRQFTQAGMYLAPLHPMPWVRHAGETQEWPKRSLPSPGHPSTQVEPDAGYEVFVLEGIPNYSFGIIES